MAEETAGSFAGSLGGAGGTAGLAFGDGTGAVDTAGATALVADGTAAVEMFVTVEVALAIAVEMATAVCATATFSFALFLAEGGCISIPSLSRTRKFPEADGAILISRTLILTLLYSNLPRTRMIFR